MKILVLTKRRYMGKDLLDDRFGRFRELPLELARLGHQVRGLCLSYRPRNEIRVIDATASRDGQVAWQSVNLMRGILPSLPGYFRQARQSISEFQPDLIWACSDAYHAIFGHRLAREFHCRLAIDLYDNFEAFSATKLPGVMFMFRRSIKKADGVTVFSQPMAAHVVEIYHMTSPHTVILSGVRKDLFYPQDRNTCREDLKLPAAAKIIGVAGALDASRDIDTLFSAFATLAKKIPDLHLALAGARSSTQKIPRGPTIHDFQSLPHERVPVFLNALDLAVVSYRRSAQGRYSFPQKVYEIIACGVPLVAAAVGSMNELLRDYPSCLYEPGAAMSLARAIQLQLEEKTAAQIIAPSWADSAAQLSRFFEKIAAPQLSKRAKIGSAS